MGGDLVLSHLITKAQKVRSAVITLFKHNTCHTLCDDDARCAFLQCMRVTILLLVLKQERNLFLVVDLSYNFLYEGDDRANDFSDIYLQNNEFISTHSSKYMPISDGINTCSSEAVQGSFSFGNLCC